MAHRSPVSIAIVKALFAASPNVCAYTGCDEKLTDPAWRETNAEIAHICGERPGAPRFDPALSVEERNSYDNLTLLCPKHHKLIDRLDPDRHTVEGLREMKAKSELHGSRGRAWATDSELVRFALLLLRSLVADDSPAHREPVRGSTCSDRASRSS
jgi:HNH endonuclease